MNHKRYFSLLFLAMTLLGVSCESRISGSLRSDGRADLVLKSALLPNTSGLLKRLAALSGSAAGTDALIFDAALMNREFAKVPAIASVTLKNTAADSVEGPLVISRVDRFLNGFSSAGKPLSFVDWKQSETGGSFAIRIDSGTGPDLLKLAPRFASLYLTALMAPIATGEKLGRDEYLLLMSSVYGKGTADEITESVLAFSIDFPGPVSGVAGGTFSGNRAEFKIPLLDLLVLDRPLVYDVRWTAPR